MREHEQSLNVIYRAWAPDLFFSAHTEGQLANTEIFDHFDKECIELESLTISLTHLKAYFIEKHKCVWMNKAPHSRCDPRDTSCM